MLPVVLGLKGNLSTFVGWPLEALGSLWMKSLGRAIAAPARNLPTLLQMYVSLSKCDLHVCLLRKLLMHSFTLYR